MEDTNADVVKLIYIVKQNNNLTAYDDFNEDTFQGPTNVTDETYGFITEAESMAFYEKGKASLRFAGTPGMYYAYPVEHHINSSRTVVLEMLCEEGGYYSLLWPAERQLCPDCDGDGTELRGSFKGMVLSEEQTSDPDFMRSYMGGDYDVKCSTCNGERWVLEPLLEDLPGNLREDYERRQEETRRYEAEESARLRNLERGIHS